MSSAASAFLVPYRTEMAEWTDAPQIFHHACAYTVFGALLTRSACACRLAVGVPSLWPNLWTVLVAPSGVGRKTTAIGMAQKILHRIDLSLQGPDEMSPEGLVEHLHERTREEASGPSTILTLPEFASLLLLFRRQYAQNLRTLLLQLHDVPDVFRRRTRGRHIEIASPRAAMLGGIATELLADYGRAEDWLGGLFSRCIMVWGRKDRDQPHKPSIPNTVYDTLAMKLGAVLTAWQAAQETRDFALFPLSKKAGVLQAELNRDGEEPHLHASLSRASTHWIKIAAIEQVDEDPQAGEIGLPAAERALQFIDLWRGSLKELIGQCFARGREDYEGDRLARRVLRYLSAHGAKVGYVQLLRNMGLRTDALRDALNSLQAAELVDYTATADGTQFVSLCGCNTDGISKSEL